MTLQGSRTVGYNGQDPIQAASIAAWLEIHGVVVIDERARYYDFITELDAAFLKWQREAKADDSESQNGTSKRT